MPAEQILTAGPDVLARGSRKVDLFSRGATSSAWRPDDRGLCLQPAARGVGRWRVECSVRLALDQRRLATRD